MSDEKLRIHNLKKKSVRSKIIKLYYMEYMMEKFGSKAAIHYPNDGKSCLHTTYIITDECKDSKDLCNQISEKICKSLYDKEKKDFKHLSWMNNVINLSDKQSASKILQAVSNKTCKIKGDVFIKNLIT